MKFFHLISFIFLFLLNSCSPPLGSGGKPGQTDFIISSVLFLMWGVVIYYLLVTRPQVLKDEAQKKMIAGLKKGDEVLIAGGLFGRVASVASDFIMVEIASGVRVKVKPGYVQAIEAIKTPATKGVETK